jgi:antirestriction protein ArdC
MNVYDVITDRILTLLDQGIVPWRRPWAGGETGIPTNLDSRRPYRGINVWLLSCAGYSSPHWVTFRQAHKLGGFVRKGERGFPVLFWRWYDKDDQGETRRIPVVRYTTAFNVQQCEGLPVELEPASTTRFPPIQACEAVLANMPHPPTVREHGGRACYLPSLDTIAVPPRSCFEKAEEFYCTLLHELVHSTGHARRLARPAVMDPTTFGNHAYSKEELVAEMGAAYLCGHTGISDTTLDNSVAYIQGWLSRLRNDKTFVVNAAAAAQKAVDFVLRRTSDLAVEPDAADVGAN